MRSKRPGRAVSLGSTFPFMLTLIINISQSINRCCRLFERSHFPGCLAQRGLVVAFSKYWNKWQVLIIYLSPFLFHALVIIRQKKTPLKALTTEPNNVHALALFAAFAAYMPVWWSLCSVVMASVIKACKRWWHLGLAWSLKCVDATCFPSRPIILCLCCV